MYPDNVFSDPYQRENYARFKPVLDEYGIPVYNYEPDRDAPSAALRSDFVLPHITIPIRYNGHAISHTVFTHPCVAAHETAHWIVASEERRTHINFGLGINSNTEDKFSPRTIPGGKLCADHEEHKTRCLELWILAMLEFPVRQYVYDIYRFNEDHFQMLFDLQSTVLDEVDLMADLVPVFQKPEIFSDWIAL